MPGRDDLLRAGIERVLPEYELADHLTAVRPVAEVLRDSGADAERQR